MSVKPIPDGYHSVTPYIIVAGAKEAIEWYTKAFGAQEELRLNGPGGSIAHAEIKIGNSHVMLGDEHPAYGAHGPNHFGGSPCHLMIYCENADEMFQRGIDEGAEVVRPIQDQFYGDRSGTLKDPFGHQWTVATHTEDLSMEEVEKRFAEMMKGEEEST